MSHDPHFGFVVAAYVLTFAVIGGMIAAIAIDYRRLQGALAALESLGRNPRSLDKSSQQDGEPEAPRRESLE